MDIKTEHIDWTLLQSFTAVAEHGSLSAAARATAGSQPTMSRHIRQLEEQVGVRLFDRTGGGVSLTEAGQTLAAHARIMADAAARISLTSQSQTETLTGTVCITASEIVATHLLPDILTALHRAEPDIDIELVASDTTSNLLRREADIAIRMYRPTQLDVITKHIGDLTLGAYAAPSYIDRHGMPETPGDMIKHVMVGYDRSELILEGFRQAGVKVNRDFFKFRCDNQVVCWRMVVAGFGIGFNQTAIGDVEPAVNRITAAGDVGTMAIWLTSHGELKDNRRIRRVFDFLEDGLSRIIR